MHLTVYQIIHTLDTICKANSLTLAQVVIHKFPLAYNVKIETNIKRQVRRTTTKETWPLDFKNILHTKFQDPISKGSWVSANVTHARTHKQTDGQSKTNMPPDFFEVGGHNLRFVHRALCD